MTFLILSIAAIALVAAPQSPDCSLPRTSKTQARVFTNADLERMAACRYQTGAESEVGAGNSESAARPARRSKEPAATAGADSNALEAD